MSFCRLPIFSAIFCYVLFSFSCRSPAGSNHSGHDSAFPLLSSPPYSGLTDSIGKSPGDAGLYFRRAELLSEEHMHELASPDYKKSWDLHPTAPTGLRYAINLSITAGSEQDMHQLLQCAQLYPGNIQFQRLLADGYIQSGKIREAAAVYDSLLHKNPADFETWYEKGRLLEQTSDTAGAISALQQAYRLQPVNTYALDLAHVYAESGNPQALVICEQVSRGDSSKQLIEPLLISGIYFSNTGQNAAAIARFDSCIGRDWKYMDAYIQKGLIYFKQKSYQRAMQIFRMAATVSNAEPQTYYWMGRCSEALNQHGEAVLNYKRALYFDKHCEDAEQRLHDLENH